jgi:hypothetical protein
VLEGAAEALTRALIEQALAGDGAALRFCVGRLLPARRDRPVAFDLPEIASGGDLVKAARAILAACAAGVLSPNEATKVMDLITSIQAIEKMGCVEKRVTELERRRQARATKTPREEAAKCDRRASRPARAAGSPREALDISGREIETGIHAPRRVACKSPVFNSTTRLVRWAKSPAAAERFILRAARFCPRGGPSIRVRTARAAPFAHPAGSVSTWVIRGPPSDFTGVTALR